MLILQLTLEQLGGWAASPLLSQKPEYNLQSVLCIPGSFVSEMVLPQWVQLTVDRVLL